LASCHSCRLLRRQFLDDTGCRVDPTSPALEIIIIDEQPDATLDVTEFEEDVALGALAPQCPPEAIKGRMKAMNE